MSELGYPTPVQGGDDPALAPADTVGGKSLLGTNASGQTKRLLVDNTSNNSLFVHVTEDDSITGGGTPTNIYGASNASFNIETNIVSYTVPVGKTFNITEVEVWGDYFAEYFVRINGTQTGGTNVSCAERSKTLEFEVAPIPATSGQVITVSVKHQAMGTVTFHCNLMGGLV